MSPPRVTYVEYLAAEEKSEVKHEYLRGEVWAMAGGPLQHALVQSNVLQTLGLALRGKPCVALGSDARVRIDATDRSTYPDVSVACGKREVSPVDPNALVNPTLIVEVLSDSTEKSDRGEKFAHYRHLASLREYVLVSQDERHVEVFTRSDDGWLMTEAGAGEAITLRSIDVVLDVDAIYADPTEP